MGIRILTEAEKEQIRERVMETYRVLRKKGWEVYEFSYAVDRFFNPEGRVGEIFASVYHSTDDETLLLSIEASYLDSLRLTWAADRDGVVVNPCSTESYGRGFVVVSLGNPDEAPTPEQAMRFLEIGS